MSEQPRVITCQGPPKCDYDLEKNPKLMPYPWCRVEVMDRLGVWHVTHQPTNQ
jgi:hypothetical protein